MLPKFITFTGVDDYTQIVDLRALAADYPVEFGVLFSPKRQGSGRYPSMPAIMRLIDERATDVIEGRTSLRLSAHVCGEHSRRLVTGEAVDGWLLNLLPHFQRMQVNTTAAVTPAAIAGWQLGPEIILQYRTMLTPTERGASWLFDASGGRGVVPAGWPWPHQGDLMTLRGYAGGLTPENVAQHVATIGSRDPTYWIDMETGVRNERDQFSIERCRRVCEAVYG